MLRLLVASARLVRCRRLNLNPPRSQRVSSASRRCLAEDAQRHPSACRHIAFLHAAYHKKEIPVSEEPANPPPNSLSPPRKEQRAVIGSLAACSPRLTPGLFIFPFILKMRRKERRRIEISATRFFLLSYNIFPPQK